jgi:hypothetical protein
MRLRRSILQDQNVQQQGEMDQGVEVIHQLELPLSVLETKILTLTSS